ncbi:MAG: hypothetical protein ACRD29_15475 [Acidimicrobiales bacterium]
MAGALLLAHQGGWDEILLVAGPIVLLAVLLWRANKKASELEADAAEEAEEADENSERA